MIGRIPFDEWLDSLRDTKAQVRIDVKLERVKLSNFGDCRSGGDKKTQARDILTAKQYNTG